MPLNVADRVRDTTTTTGTGTITLSGTPPTGYQSFSAVGNGNTTYYTINAGAQWEVGIGTYLGAGPTLSRDTVLASSNSGSLVNFSAGTKDVFCDYPASKSISDGFGLLPVPNGGTGVATLTSGYLVKGNGTSAVSASVIYDTGTNVGIGTSSPTFKLQVSGNLYTSSNVQFYDQDGFRFASSAAYTSLRMGSAYTGESTGEFAYDRTNGALTYKQGNTGSTLTERMRIDGSGNLGVGTASPAYKLDVTGQGRATTGWAVSTDGSAFTPSGLNAIPNYGTGYITSTAITTLAGFGGIAAYTNQLERMRIDSSGNVGIGTSSPAARLHVVNSTVNAQFRLQDVTTDATNKYGVVGTGHYTNAQSPILAVGVGSLSASNTVYVGGGFGSLNAATAIQFFTAANNTTLTGTERMRIDSSGQVGIGVTPMATGANGNLLQIGNPTTSAGSGLTIGSTVTADIQFSDATTGAGQYAGLIRYSHSTDHMALWTASAERMRIDSSGNVGIGTSSPATKLEVKGAGFVAASISGDSTSETQLRFNTNVGARISQQANQALIFDTNAAERMRITSNGSVGIGTSSPGGLLHVVAGTNDSLLFRGPISLATGGSIFAVNAANTSIAPLEFAATTFYFNVGNVGIGTTSPGAKLDVAGSITSRGDGSEGGQISLNNAANSAAVYFFDVDGSGHGRVFTVTNNTNLFLGQLSGTGGQVLLYTNGAERFRITSTGGITSSDLADAVGYKGLPQNSRTSAYTLVLADQGKHIYATSTAFAVTIPANSTTAFPIGTALTIVVEDAAKTVVPAAGVTLVLAGTGAATTGTRTMAIGSVATLLKVGTDRWYISGAGVT